MNNRGSGRLIGIRDKKQAGYTLLEYCAGAAVMAGIVWIAVGQLGGSMRNYLGQLSEWLNNRAAEINDSTAAQNSDANSDSNTGNGAD